MEIKVFGPGCANCHKVEDMVKAAIEELGIKAEIKKVTDIIEIMKNTNATPAIMINGKMKYKGKPLPTLDKVKELIKEEL
ncbi:MAG: thioredoxin family protein [Thermodesulfovibrionales bacterium]|nr:thioredoxin family protein [Thermodesulfovibrionales bacterium]